MGIKKKLYIIFFFIINIYGIAAQENCFNQVEIKQLGIEFCLPDLDWKIEEEDELKFISIKNSKLNWGTNSYYLKTEKVSQDLSSLKYLENSILETSNIPNYEENIVSKGVQKINGKKFYFVKSKTKYKTKGIEKNSYSITYYYVENEIGYALSMVVSDENIDKWNDKEALKIWSTFKIKSLPEKSFFEE